MAIIRTETAEYVKWVDGGISHTLYKTIPPKQTVEIDFSDERLPGNTLTFAEIIAIKDTKTTLI